MRLFDVYPLFDIELSKGQGVYVWDNNGRQYLDLYGGHAVISIGHNHPHYIAKLKQQLDQLGFYSNTVKISLQQKLAEKLTELSGYHDYQLFLCNSGAEANENALKLASFHNQRTKVIAFKNAFHGRTSAALEITDNPTIRAPFHQSDKVIFLPLNDKAALEQVMKAGNICAVIIEGIQGVGGINMPEKPFLQKIQQLCNDTGALLILDEIQSGYGRSGQFFAHQHSRIQPDLITIAKGMGNGFPIAGVLIHPQIQSSHGLLGTTFGGNHLACAAGIAVLEILDTENLITHSFKIGEYLIERLRKIENGIREVRGKGLMIGIELTFPCAALRKALLIEQHIFTGASANKNTIRILPPLILQKKEADAFLEVFKLTLSSMVS